MKLKVDEAVKRAQQNGKFVRKKDIAQRLWTGGTPASQQVNMTKLCTGRMKTVRPEWVNIICDICDVSADFLFGRAEK